MRCATGHRQSSWRTITPPAVLRHRKAMSPLRPNLRLQVQSSELICWITSFSTAMTISAFWKQGSCNCESSIAGEGRRGALATESTRTEGKAMMLTSRFDQALWYATLIHATNFENENIGVLLHDAGCRVYGRTGRGKMPRLQTDGRGQVGKPTPRTRTR